MAPKIKEVKCDVVISTKMPPHMAAQVERFADERALSRSDVVRQAVIEYMQRVSGENSATISSQSQVA